MIRRIVGVASGKGGVGKSTVTCLMARTLADMGYRVGILDADITGPSIPRMMGVSGNVTKGDNGMVPPISIEGIKVISMNLLLRNDDDAVIFRGPVVSEFVRQFYNDVDWGELDFLLVDMPPGTGDVPLTVFQSLPITGIVLVTSPQELVSMIVRKAYNMAVKMNIPVLGIVENYSYFECGGCGRRECIFGESHIEEEAEQLGVKVLGRLPFVTGMSASADKGLDLVREELDLSVLTDDLYDFVLFDLDGTLTDPKVGITTCVQHALKAIGIEPPDNDELTDFIGPPLREHFMERFGLDFELGEFCVEKYRERYNPIGIYENVIYPGIKEMLETLRQRNIRLAVASSKPLVMVNIVLEHFGIKDCFDVIAGSELDGSRTRKSEVIKYAFELAGQKGISFSCPLMVGDRMHDIEGAREAGIPVMAVAYGYGSRKELEDNHPDYIADTVEDIARIIR